MIVRIRIFQGRSRSFRLPASSPEKRYCSHADALKNFILTPDYRIRNLLATLFLLISYPFPLTADFRAREAGTSSAQFLRLGAHARAEALGSAYGAVAEDASALYFNPAGITLLPSKNLVLMHSFYLESISYSYAAFAFPVKRSAGLGLSVQYLSAGEIEQISEEGLSSGNFRPENLALSFGGAFRWKNFAAGASAKYVRSRILDTASAATMDLGIIYAQEFFRLGFSFQNFFSFLTFDRTAHPLPLNLKLSSAYRPIDIVLLVLDLNFPRDNQPELNAGLEWSFGTDEWLISPKAGYNSRTRNLSGLQGLTLGAGMVLRSYSLDYAWIPLGDLDNPTEPLSLFAGKALSLGAETSDRQLSPVSLSSNEERAGVRS